MGYALLQEDYISAEDYLWREQQATDCKHEYINGKVFAMAGASRRHNRAVGNLFARLHQQVRGTPCQVFGSDMKLHIQRRGDVRFYYPDLQISCEDEPETYYNTRPILIAEVLSESTSRIDRGEKLEAYKAIPSLQCILLIHTAVEHVELYARDAHWEGWVYTATETLPLTCINLEMPISDIYAD
ncbi:MAG: Uma2 family endonuclease [Halothiobacillaceae bacterium]|nr:Uma2 family endonuclease [Halothiobacillaceae bacterium]